MIQGLNNSQLPKRPEDLKSKSVQGLQQQAAQRQLPQRGQENQDLAPSEQVSYSKELSDDTNGAYQQDNHQGMDAMLANLMAFPKQIEANDKVNEVGKSGQVGKVDEAAQKPKVRELKAEEKFKDPKAADRMGNLKVSSKNESLGLRDKPRQPGVEQTASHSKPGSKGAPKTNVPRPVGQPESLKNSKPDGKTGLRQLPQVPNPRGQNDGVDLSEETRAALKQPAYA